MLRGCRIQLFLIWEINIVESKSIKIVEKKSITVPNKLFFECLLEEFKTTSRVKLVVKGWSMFPFLRTEKDSVVLEKVGEEDEIELGGLYLFCLNGANYILHRCVALPKNCASNISSDDYYIFRGDGNLKIVEKVLRNEIKAKVIKRITPLGKEWSCDSLSWKIASRLWPKSYLFRRLFLGVLRRIYK